MIVWKLDALMRARRVRGRKLAKALGIGENYLSRVRHEVPDRLSLSLLDGLCRELGCDIADLLAYQPSPAAEAPETAIAPPPPVTATPRPRAPKPAPAEPPEPAAAAPEARPVEPSSPQAAPEPEPAVAPPPERTRVQLPLMASLTSSPGLVVPEKQAGEPEAQAGAAYVRGGALSAKLSRLKKRP